MALTVNIDAKARIFRLFDLAQVLGESELDLSEMDLSQTDDIRRVYETVTEFVETGEVGAYDDMLFHMHGLDPETCEITLSDTTEKSVSPDEITLENQPVGALVRGLENLEPGKVLLATLTEGDARWDFDSDMEVESANPSDLVLGYYDCSAEEDQYDVMGNALFEYLCDTFSTDQIKYAGNSLELQDFVFHPQQVLGQLFVVTQSLDSDVTLLERISPVDTELQDYGWQLLVNPANDI